MKRELVLGTRGSALALAQADIVTRALSDRFPALTVRAERITTRGDAQPETPIAALGRGVFVKEIEASLLSGRIDAAVHSAKDLPSTLDAGLAIAAFLPRADARDVLISRAGRLAQLPPGARIGTSSPRRISQLRSLRPDLELLEMRGNVDTRLRKLRAGEFDAIVLAAAGLIRLGLESEITEWLEIESMIPCVGQGALAVEVRAGDPETAALVATLDDAATRSAVVAERAFLAELGAGCLAPAAAHAHTSGGRLRIHAMLGSFDGRTKRGRCVADASNAEAAGVELARELLSGGGAKFLSRPDSPLSGWRVAVTRTPEQSAALLEILRARGALPVSCPTIAIEPVPGSAELDAGLRGAAEGDWDWIVFTSANSVRALSDGLTRLNLELPGGVRLAAVGAMTAEVLREELGSCHFVSPVANGEALAESLPDVAGRAVLVPASDLANPLLPDRLSQRGAAVKRLVVYRTVPGAGLGELTARINANALDAVIFASPSALRPVGETLARASGRGRPAIVCVGPTTAAAAHAVGLTAAVVASRPAVGAIVEALEQYALRVREVSAHASHRS